MKQIRTLSLLLLLCLESHQILSQEHSSMRQIGNQINNIEVGPSWYSIMYAVDEFVNVYNDAKREQQLKEEAQSKLAVVRTNYESYDSYPDSIATGWHNVIFTDNLRFCQDAKVFVRDNQVQEFVIDNCYPLSFTITGKIRKARNVVTLNKFNGEQLEIVDVYFLYDLDEPRLVSPPLRPGYVTFWTKKRGYVNQTIILNDVAYDGVTQTHKEQPECRQEGTLTVMLKPGTYSIRAMKTGNDLDGTLKIESDQCLLYSFD